MREKILVVDDEETMRRSLADILRLEGYHVQAVSSGPAALEALKRETYDLMLLDLKMPGMDGLEVLRTTTRISPDTMVILLTAHGSLESAIEALRQDAFDYLLKPSSPQQILNSVAGALSQRSEAQRKRDLIDQLDSSLQELRKDVERRDLRPEKEPTVISLGQKVWADLGRREIWMESGLENPRIGLTPAEGKLFKVLWESHGQVLTHRELVKAVQGYDVTDWEAPEVLRPLVSRLRQKLSAFPGGEEWITNVRGTGYVLDVK